ncbi:hypothetical protein [Streptomyces altiplanensis]
MAVAAWVIKKNVDTKKITSAIAEAGSPAMDAISGQVRKELVGAGKEASAAAVGTWADRLADSLHERTVRLQEEPPGDKDAKGPEDTKEPKEPEEPKGAKKAETETEEEPDTDRGADTETETDKPSRARARKAEKPAARKKAAGGPAAPRGDRRGGGTKRRSGE